MVSSFKLMLDLRSGIFDIVCFTTEFGAVSLRCKPEIKALRVTPLSGWVTTVDNLGTKSVKYTRREDHQEAGAK